MHFYGRLELGRWHWAPRHAFLRGFPVAQLTCTCGILEKHDFPCIFTAGLNWVDGIGPRGLHFYLVFMYRN